MNLWLYLLGIQLVTYLLFWGDKRSARRGGARVPESMLLLASLLGGTFTAIVAMIRLRHKTRKGSFQVKFFMIVVVQIGLLIYQPAALQLLLARLFG